MIQLRLPRRAARRGPRPLPGDLGGGYIEVILDALTRPHDLGAAAAAMAFDACAACGGPLIWPQELGASLCTYCTPRAETAEVPAPSGRAVRTWR